MGAERPDTAIGIAQPSQFGNVAPLIDAHISLTHKPYPTLAGDLTRGTERFILCVGGPHQDTPLCARRPSRADRRPPRLIHWARQDCAYAPLVCGRCPACVFLNRQLLDLTRAEFPILAAAYLPPAGVRRIKRRAPLSMMPRRVWKGCV